LSLISGSEDFEVLEGIGRRRVGPRRDSNVDCLEEVRRPALSGLNVWLPGVAGEIGLIEEDEEEAVATGRGGIAVDTDRGGDRENVVVAVERSSVRSVEEDWKDIVWPGIELSCVFGGVVLAGRRRGFNLS
jgi:hypothetical protein